MSEPANICDAVNKARDLSKQTEQLCVWTITKLLENATLSSPGLIESTLSKAEMHLNDACALIKDPKQVAPRLEVRKALIVIRSQINGD